MGEDIKNILTALEADAANERAGAIGERDLSNEPELYKGALDLVRRSLLRALDADANERLGPVGELDLSHEPELYNGALDLVQRSKRRVMKQFRQTSLEAGPITQQPLSPKLLPDAEGEIKLLDWPNISKELYNRTNVYRSVLPMVFNMGKSCEDVVQDLLEAFFTSENHLGWDPAKSPVVEKEGLENGLIVFLGQILAKRMIDQHRAYQRRPHLSIDAENGARLIETVKDEARSAETELQFAELQEQLIERANGDETVIAMIKVASEITGSGKVDRDLAEMVTGDCSATHTIVKARKRFITKREKDVGRGISHESQ